VSANPITTSRRYYQQGVSKVIWTPTIAVVTGPTRAEINAGTDLSPEVSASSGWEVTSNTQATPALGSVFIGNILATTTAADSSLTFYADSTSVDVRSLLTRGLTGFVIWMGEGDVAGYTMDVFPVMVTSAPKNRTITATAEIVVNFSITRTPAENVVIPT
jgi:hypothetical protein